MLPAFKPLTAIAGIGTILMLAPAALATTLIRVTIENLAPADGTIITLLWVGFHDGTFDLYDRGSPASTGLERIAEDGTIAPLSAEFLASGAGTVDGALTGVGLGSGTPPVIPPNTIATREFTLDGTLPSSQYFSYAAMIVPSNDAFIANGNPLAFKIFDDFGNFLGADFIVEGSNVLDAGTEDNDEIQENTALLGQTIPDTGTATIGGVVELHPGFIPGGNVITAFPGADFTVAGYQVARIRVEQVQVPEASLWQGLLAVGGFLGASSLMRHRNQSQ